MKKRVGSVAFIFIIIFTLLFFPGQLKAQLSIGLEGGVTRNYVITTTSSLPFTVAQPVSGYTIGIPIEYKVKEWFSVMADPNLAKKNYRYVRTDFFQGVYELHNNTYLQFPLIGHFTFGPERLKGFLNIGGYVGYWAGGMVSGSEPNILNPVDDAFFKNNPSGVFGENKSYSFSEQYTFDSRRDNRFEAGWVLGLGVSYQLTSRYKLFVEARQTQALTDQQKNYMLNQIPRYNQTYGLTLGCLVSLQKLVPAESDNLK